MKKTIASHGTFSWPAFYRFLPLLLLGAWLAACTSQLTTAIDAAPLPVHQQSWAQVAIPKPTYTPLPTLSPPPTSTEVIQNPTSDPGQLSAEIVSDTSTPEVAAEYLEAQQPDVPVSPASGGGKYILVSISEQHLYAYEGDTLAYSFVASTGMDNATRAGTFSVLDKIPNAYGETWNIWMPNWLGIYYAGSLENGIHALPILPGGARLWAGFLGRPISYGCIVLGVDESQLLYDWADIGTPVEIRR
jgi:lipoprotein-anchoring transpeptidase ErfK/SrfK